MASEILDLIRSHAEQTPSCIALLDRTESIDYKQLDAGIGRLSQLLVSRGVRAGDIVPVVSSRCIEAIVAFLGILQTGACYVPIDYESWSQQRVSNTINTVPHRVLVNTTLGLSTTVTTISKADIRNCLIPEIDFPSEETRGSEHKNSLAYIIFTSGTTGSPKGVMISCESLLHYVKQGHDIAPFNLGTSLGERVLLLLSVAFDAFSCVTFSTLCNGGTIFLSQPSTFIEDAKTCNILPLTPSLLKLLPDPSMYESVHSVFLGGEEVSMQLIEQWSSDRRKIFNGYGATETTCTSLLKQLQPGEPVTLGTPIAESEVFLLNNDLEPVSEGEIAITGKGLAVGYYMDSDLTSQKFLCWRNSRIYLTGDLARRTKHGIEFVGRKDSMVKNRGFLINIEHQVIPLLRDLDGVRDAAALLHLDLLIAFITPKDIDTDSVHRRLQMMSDKFLMPDKIYNIDQIPLTTNGKIDLSALKVIADTSFESIQPESGDFMLDVLKSNISQVLIRPQSTISADASFLALGGNSLSAIRLISNLTQQGFELSIPNLFESDSLREVREKMGKLEERIPDSVCNCPFLPPTSQQVQMMRSSIAEQNTSTLLVRIMVNLIDSIVTSSTLKSAWRQLMERHSMFHFGFDHMLESLVRTMPVFNWEHTLTQQSSYEENIETAVSKMLAQSQKINDNGLYMPTNNFHLIETKDEATLLWHIHHCLVDGWSMEILIHELKCILQGSPLWPAVQFPNFLHYKENASKKSNFHNDQYWRSKIRYLSPHGSLTPFKRAPTSNGQRAYGEVQKCSKLRVADLERKCQLLQVTIASIIYGSWAILISEYLSMPNVMFGAVLSGRTIAMPHVDKIVGPLMNVIPLVVHIPETGKCIEYLKAVQDTLMSTQVHQWDAQKLGMMRLESGRLFDSLVAIDHDLFVVKDLSSPTNLSLDISRRDFPEFDLTLYIENKEGKLIIRLIYSKTIYQNERMNGLLDHFSNVVDAFLDLVNQDISTVKNAVLSPLEQSSLLNVMTPIEQDSHYHTDLKTAFEHAVDKWPAIKAIESASGCISFAELDKDSNVLANYLTLRTKKGDQVAVLSDGSIEWVICAIAVVKSGAVYTPLDIGLPQGRLESYFYQAKSTLCIVPNLGCRHKTRGIQSYCVMLEDILCHSSEYNRSDLCLKPEDPAYMIFTSGTTGRPKAIKGLHGAVTSYLSCPAARMYVSPGRRHAQMFSVGFDVSIAELFGTLCFGGTLVLKQENTLSHLLHADAMMATPSLLAAINPEDYRNLDTVMLAGEEIPQQLANRWTAHVRLLNGYGPSECTIVCMINELAAQEPVTIGHAVPGTRVYILNKERRPVPVGVSGEICISGIQVVKGYAESQDHENARFMDDPFHPGCRMFCSGDFGVWNSDHTVSYLGRKDQQVKVLGYRVELQEVEHSILCASKEVEQVAAILFETEIIGFISPRISNTDKLMDQLALLLPNYAIPAKIFALESLPLTSNQKLDRRALSEMIDNLIHTKIHKTSLQLPLTTTQLIIAEAWTEILGATQTRKFGINDSFSSLGGNSLKQIKLSQSLSRRFGFKIPLKFVIECLTLSSLADAIDEYAKSPRKSLKIPFPLVREGGKKPTKLSRVEEVIFQQHLHSDTPSALHINLNFKLTGAIDINRLRRAITWVFSRHEILRTTYLHNGANMKRGAVLTEQKSNGVRILQSPNSTYLDEVKRPIDITKELPAQAHIMEETDCVWLLLKFHHIVVDQKSIQMILQETSEAYSQLNCTNSFPVQRDTIGYAHWAEWKRKNEKAPSGAEKDYWRHQLDDIPKPPFTEHFCHYYPTTGAHTSFLVDCENRSLGYVLAIIAIATKAVTNSDEMVIAVSHMDRSEPGTSTMIGLFLDYIPVRIQLHKYQDLSVEYLTKKASETLTENLSNVLSSFQINRLLDLDRTFDIMVTYRRREDSYEASLQLPGVLVEQTAVHLPVARFPFLVEVNEIGNQIQFTLEYCTDLISETQAQIFKAVILDTVKTTNRKLNKPRPN